MTHSSLFEIYPAEAKDAEAVSRLMYEAIGDIAHTLAGTTDLPETLETLAELFRSPGCRLSRENALVCKDEQGRLAGFALSYAGADAEALDAPLLRRLRERGLPTAGLLPEARPGEYYLDSLAVDGAYRGAGLGTRLIEAFERRAAELGERQAMLLVDRANVKARALYERLGYREDGSIELSGHLYDRMIKPVGSEG
jgi:ribosomal protein S18 acetylase RimI-like enzyme